MAPRKQTPSSKLDEELEESFPASDPPAFTGASQRVGAPAKKPRKTSKAKKPKPAKKKTKAAKAPAKKKAKPARKKKRAR